MRQGKWLLALVAVLALARGAVAGTAQQEWVNRDLVARYGHALAYDSARFRTVLFGGAGNIGVLSDTWEWDGTTWTQKSLATSPPARSSHALAYDSARGRTVLFGGRPDSGLFSDTWELRSFALPLADAGTGRTVNVGTLVALDGSGSGVD